MSSPEQSRPSQGAQSSPGAEQGPSPSFHRGSFTEEIETARTDLSRRLLLGGSQPDTPSITETAPSLSPTASATPSTPELGGDESPLTPPEGEEEEMLVADSFAFAFDIDGVLVRGGRAIPEAMKAMKVLNGENKYGIKV